MNITVRRICGVSYKGLFILAAIIFSAISLSPYRAHSETNAASLQEGKKLFDGGKYNEAVEKLNLAYKEVPLMGDYILFYTARAYFEMDDYRASNSYIEELLKVYPDTQLRKRARGLQVRNDMKNYEVSESLAVSKLLEPNTKGYIAEGKSEGIVKAVEQYYAEYPEDSDTAFLTAQFLKKHGKAERAGQIFRQLYISNSPFSEAAYKELKPADITAADLLTKAANFINATEYKKAEELLRKILPTSDNALKVDIRRKLGLALFRQKKYKEAAAEYLKLGDIYNTARAQYRAGEFETFNKSVSRMVSVEDSRAGSLLAAFAAKKRREGKTEEALKIYGDVRKMYPLLKEEALWGMAWTYYRKGDYQTALNILTELRSNYSSSMYIYWAARCLECMSKEEAAGNKETAEGLYQQAAAYKDFYGLLSKFRKGNGNGEQPDFLNALSGLTARPDKAAVELKPSHGYSLTAMNIPHKITRVLERSNILLQLGLKNDALTELICASNSASEPQLLLYLGRKMQEAGAYKRAIAVVSRITNNQGIQEQLEQDMKEILYPLAYWPIVKEMSDKYGIDPLVLLSIMREESRYDPEAASVAGALGLMQLMPATAHKIANNKVNLKGELVMRDITTNITIGAYYLSSLMKEFSSFPAAVAAYNAGPDKTKEWLKEGNYRAYDEFIEDIPYNETRNYVKRVMFTFFSYANMDRL